MLNWFIRIFQVKVTLRIPQVAYVTSHLIIPTAHGPCVGQDHALSEDAREGSVCCMTLSPLLVASGIPWLSRWINPICHLPMTFSLCLHIIFPECEFVCVQIPFFNKDTSHIALEPTLMTSSELG